MTHFVARTDRHGVEFAGAFDLATDRAEEFSKKYAGRHFVDIADLLRDKSIDAAVVLTRPPAHAPLTRQSLDAGKHVLSEKPLATNLDDGRALVDLAQRNRLVLACAPFLLLGTVQRRAGQMLAGGSIGSVVLAVANTYHGRLESWHGDAEAFYRDSGGPVMDVGPYPLSLLIHWLGPVQSVRAWSDTLLPQRSSLQGKPFKMPVHDHTCAILRFRSGAVARIDISCVDCNSHLHGIELHGQTGSLSLTPTMDFHGELTLSRPGGQWELIDGDRSPKPMSGVDWSAGIMELAAAVREDRQAANSGRLAMHVLETLVAIERAASSNTEIEMASFANESAAASNSP